MSKVSNVIHQTPTAELIYPWLYSLAWVLGAGLLGFAASAIFAGIFQLPRTLFLIPYLGLSGIFVYGFFRWSKINLIKLISHNWYWGLIGAVLCCVFVVNNVLSQPASPRPEGLNLLLDLIWSGVLYGLMDALLLSIVPVLATWQAFSSLGWTTKWYGKLAVGFLALTASSFVTAVYHLGYPEFRNATVSQPLFGNSVLTLAYLLTNNPLSAVLAHISMHVAGVLHGSANIAQLPPHY